MKKETTPNFLKCGIIRMKYSEEVKTNSGIYYVACFRNNVKWLIFGQSHMDENIKTFLQEGFCRYSLYSISKKEDPYGILLPRTVKSGDREGQPYLLALQNKYMHIPTVRKAYYIFDVDSHCEIMDGASVYFDVNNEHLLREDQITRYSYRQRRS